MVFLITWTTYEIQEQWSCILCLNLVMFWWCLVKENNPLGTQKTVSWKSRLVRAAEEQIFITYHLPHSCRRFMAGYSVKPKTNNQSINQSSFELYLCPFSGESQCLKSPHEKTPCCLPWLLKVLAVKRKWPSTVITNALHLYYLNYLLCWID